MRARVVASHLAALGHEVRLAAAGRAASILRGHGFTVVDVRGIVMHYEGGRVRRARTLFEQVCQTPRRVEQNVRAALEQATTFRPHVVVTDFSSFACLVAHLTGAPLFSIDHQHVLDRFVHPPALVEDFASDFALAEALVRAKTPGCRHYVVTSFYAPPTEPAMAASTTLVAPLLRPELARFSPTKGDHVVVYQTAGEPRALLPVLASLPELEFHVYGAGRPARHDNVVFRSFDEAGFLADLASARAVVTNGGFTAIAEALHFRKPVLSVPLVHQAEQQLNAAWLAALGLGLAAPRITANAIRELVERAPELCAANERELGENPENGLDVVNRLLEEVA
jgi:uncharacterized protein (TIGR00661 family)